MGLAMLGRRWLGAGLGLWLAVAPVSAATLEREREIDGLTRTYTLVTPDGQAEPRATAFILHGGNGTGAKIRRYVQFDEPALRQGYVIVYPDGTDRQWNDGRLAPIVPRVDDVKFLRTIAEDLIAEKIADPRRITVAGISNGGMMAMRLACEAWDRFAAVGVIAAQLPNQLDCRPGREMPILFVLGTEDRFVPFKGGAILSRGPDRGGVISATATLDFWRANNGCAPALAVTALPDRDAGDGTTVTRQVGVSCRAPVEAYIIEGGGHAWPGGRDGALAVRLLGTHSREIDVNALLLEFWRPL